MANLNNEQNKQKGVFKNNSLTRHAQFEFSRKSSQVCTNRDDRLSFDCRSLFSHFIENVLCKLDTQNINVPGRFFGVVQLTWVMIS